MAERVFFKSSSGGHGNAFLWQGRDPFYPYAEGYLRAADILTDQCISGVHCTLPYPIVFNYRHFVELKFKEIIIKGRGFLGEDIDHTKKQDFHDHNLSRLWNLAKETVNKISEGSLEFEEFQKIDVLVAEFEEIDPSSEAFRFHINRKGNETLSNIVEFSLPHLKEQMNEIANALDAITSGIDQYIDDKGETIRTSQ